MSIRQFILTAIVVTAVIVGREVFGDRWTIGYFVIVGIAGLVGIVLFERGRARLNGLLASLPDEARDELLMWLENSEMRAIATADSGRHGPRVPLRGEAESFRYPPSHARTTGWTLNLWIFMAGFVAIGYVADRVSGGERFFPARQPWWETFGTIAMFVAGAILTWWLRRETQAEVRVTDTDLTLMVPGRATRRISWPDVRDVRINSLTRGLQIRDARVRIAFSDRIVTYGRLLNLILTRLPASARVRAA